MLLADGRMAVQVYNFPSSWAKEAAIQKVSESVASIKSLTPLDISVNAAASQSVKLRFKHGAVPADIKAKLSQVRKFVVFCC